MANLIGLNPTVSSLVKNHTLLLDDVELSKLVAGYVFNLPIGSSAPTSPLTTAIVGAGLKTYATNSSTATSESQTASAKQVSSGGVTGTLGPETSTVAGKSVSKGTSSPTAQLQTVQLSAYMRLTASSTDVTPLPTVLIVGSVVTTGLTGLSALQAPKFASSVAAAMRSVGVSPTTTIKASSSIAAYQRLGGSSAQASSKSAISAAVLQKLSGAIAHGLRIEANSSTGKARTTGTLTDTSVATSSNTSAYQRSKGSTSQTSSKVSLNAASVQRLLGSVTQKPQNDTTTALGKLATSGTASDVGINQASSVSGKMLARSTSLQSNQAPHSFVDGKGRYSGVSSATNTHNNVVTVSLMRLTSGGQCEALRLSSGALGKLSTTLTAEFLGTLPRTEVDAHAVVVILEIVPEYVLTVSFDSRVITTSETQRLLIVDGSQEPSRVLADNRVVAVPKQ